MATQLHLHHGFHDDDAVICNLQRKTPLQLQTLQNLYSDDKQPTQRRMEDYASALGLTYEQVKRWFIARRQKDKPNVGKTRGGRKNSAGNREKRKGKTKNGKNIESLVLREDGSTLSGPFHLQDMLYSPDYILDKVFRKDGPPLGVEFDHLPATAFQGSCGTSESGCSQAACQDGQREFKRRKVFKPAILNSEKHNQKKTPMKHGMGKGLVSVMQLMSSETSCQDNVRASNRRKVPPCKHSSSAKKHGIGKGLMTVMRLADHDSENIRNRRPQKKKPVSQRRSSNKLPPKKKPPVRKKKVDCKQPENQKARRECCKLALDLASYKGNICSFETLEDDEELELWMQQAGASPLTCSAHFTTGGTHGCSLCKGLLPKFPPGSVRMKTTLSMPPWNLSLELVKKFFKVFHFLYTYAEIIDVCPFIIDELAQAFQEKDSLLIGKLHVCLIENLLSDIEKELCDGAFIHSSKNRMFLNLVHSAQDQKFNMKFWKTYLNPLTWTEILRQVLVAAGFGSKDGICKKGCLQKEADHMIRYGLKPGTLKGELFRILLEQGNGGTKVAELAKSSAITNLSLEKANSELEDVICSTLASDITVFEKISSSTYRLRSTSFMKNDEEAQSDSEDYGTIENDSRDCIVLSINNSDHDSGNLTSRLEAKHHSAGSSSLSLGTEIDESHPGESWLLGLMEGEYSDLNIEEKLNAFLALVDLLSAGSSIRVQDPSMALAECVPSIYQQGSGGKIKRSSLRQPRLLYSSWGDVREAFGAERRHQSSEFHPVDSSVLSLISNGKDKSSSKVKGSSGAEIGYHLHPMQSIFLGSDRRYNRYWLFLGPCDTDDPGHRRVYFESSEDGHWEVIDCEEALCGLLVALNGQGRREAALLASLEKCMEILVDEISSVVPIETCVSQSTQSDISEIDRINEDSPSPVSDIDNNLSLAESSRNSTTLASLPVFQVEKKVKEQKQKYIRLQAYDLWVWSSFYSCLRAVQDGKQSYFDSLARCESCHDLYWRDERHCKICHTTFELDFDIEEKYTVHVATCHRTEDADTYPTYKVLPSQLQALKAAVHVIELAIPEDAFMGAWKKYAHKLWVRRLRRTSSLHELLQVLADFVGAVKPDWLLQCNDTVDSDSIDVVACFKNMPQTSSAVALWLVQLDASLASRTFTEKTN